MSILNDKTAVESTSLFLQRFQSIEAQNGPFATDARFPAVKLTFASPQKWIFNAFWTPMEVGNHGPVQSPTPGNLSFPKRKSELLMVLKGALRAQGSSSKVI